MTLVNRPALPLFVSVAARSAQDFAEFAARLATILERNPSATIDFNESSSTAVVRGETERQLESIIGPLSQSGIPLTVSPPEIAYLETIARQVMEDKTYKRQSGGQGQYARVVIQAVPNNRGSGNEFSFQAPSDAVPARFFPGIEKGFSSALLRGPLGYPVTDIKFTLIDGAHHEIDSSFESFEIATRAAVREILDMAGSILLEPIMRVEVSIPEDCVGAVVGDLNSRRGQIVAVSNTGTDVAVSATAPLVSLLGYEQHLSSLTKGRGSSTFSFSHYESSDTPDGPENFPPAIGLRA